MSDKKQSFSRFTKDSKPPRMVANETQKPPEPKSKDGSKEGGK